MLTVMGKMFKNPQKEKSNNVISSMGRVTWRRDVKGMDPWIQKCWRICLKTFSHLWMGDVIRYFLLTFYFKNKTAIIKIYQSQRKKKMVPYWCDAWNCCHYLVTKPEDGTAQGRTCKDAFWLTEVLRRLSHKGDPRKLTFTEFLSFSRSSAEYSMICVSSCNSDNCGLAL